MAHRISFSYGRFGQPLENDGVIVCFSNGVLEHHYQHQERSKMLRDGTYMNFAYGA